MSEATAEGGGPTALMRALHDGHARPLRRFCLHLVGHDHARADDLVQEALLRAWRRPAVLTEPPGRQRAWLQTVARNLVIDEWRSARARSEDPVATLPERRVTGDDHDRTLTALVVNDAMTHLSDRHRAVLVECFFVGSPEAEAAVRLQIPAGTVKSRKHYALRLLKRALCDAGVTAV